MAIEHDVLSPASLTRQIRQRHPHFARSPHRTRCGQSVPTAAGKAVDAHSQQSDRCAQPWRWWATTASEAADDHSKQGGSTALSTVIDQWQKRQDDNSNAVYRPHHKRTHQGGERTSCFVKSALVFCRSSEALTCAAHREDRQNQKATKRKRNKQGSADVSGEPTTKTHSTLRLRQHNLTTRLESSTSRWCRHAE